MKAVVLAAGEGWRLRPVTFTRPKHLIPVGGRPLLVHILNSLRETGFREVLIVVHYEADKIKEYLGDGSKFNMKIEYIHQPRVMGTADATRLVEDYVEENFLLIYGDLFITPTVIRRVLDAYTANSRFKPVVTMASVPVKHPEHYGVLILEGSYVVDIVEKPAPGTVESNLVNAGVYIFSTEIFDAIRRTSLSARGELEITDSIHHLIKNGRPVIAVDVSRGEWLDVGNPWDLLEANKRALIQIKPEVRGTVEKGAHIKGPVSVAENARVRSGAYIEGPVLIGEGSDIGPNCHIRPFTSIGRNVRVGNACEVKNSIIMDSVTVGRLSYIGDSVIGEGCVLGAGSIFANYRFDSESVKMNVLGRIVDTKRTEMGVVMGDHVKVGVGALFMPGVKIGCNSWIGPNVVVYRDVPSNTILTLKQNVLRRAH